MSIQGFSLDQIKSYTYKDKQAEFYVLKNISVFFKRLNYAVFHFKIITNKKLANCAITKLENTDKKTKSFNKVKEVCEAILLRINQKDPLQQKFKDLIKPKENSSSESSDNLLLSDLNPEEPQQGQIPFVEAQSSSTPESLEGKPSVIKAEEDSSSSSEPLNDHQSSPLTREKQPKGFVEAQSSSAPESLGDNPSVIKAEERSSSSSEHLNDHQSSPLTREKQQKGFVEAKSSSVPESLEDNPSVIKAEEDSNSSSEPLDDHQSSPLTREKQPKGFVEAKSSSAHESLEDNPSVIKAEEDSSSSEPSDDQPSSPLTREDGQVPTEMKESFSLRDNQLLNPITSYNTNLNENKSRPSWVPQKCVSKKGLLSTRNFSTCCLAPDGNNQKNYQWFFSQHKFPVLGRTDTFIVPRWIEDDVSFSEFPMCPTRDGYAISPSARRSDRKIFISDTDIMNIDECTTFRMMSRIPIGIYADGKTMVQQQGERGCVAACAAMMAEDYGQKFSIETLTNANLADTDMLLQMLKKANLPAAEVKIKDISQMSDLIKDYGPISLAIDSKGIGGHQIILDAITDKAATIRDPFHGWRITILLKVLSGWVDRGIEAVYIKPISIT